MSDSEERLRELARRATRQAKCPACGVPPRVCCRSAKGHVMLIGHAERLELLAGIPETVKDHEAPETMCDRWYKGVTGHTTRVEDLT